MGQRPGRLLCADCVCGGGQRRRASVLSATLLLPTDDLRLVKLSWEQRPPDTGTAIVVAFLTGRASHRHLFAQDTKQPLDRRHPLLLQTGQRLDLFITRFIDALENDQLGARNMCRTLGQLHYHKGVHYHEHDFDWFKQCVVDVVLHRLHSPEKTTLRYGSADKRVWCTMLDYVVREMLHGIIQQTLSACKQSEPDIVITTTKAEDGADDQSIGQCSLAAASRRSSMRSRASFKSSLTSSPGLSRHLLAQPMTRRGSMFSRKTSACSLPDAFESLNEEERRDLRDLLRVLSDKSYGEQIMLAVFDAKPRLTQLFGIDDVDALSLADHVNVRVQGCRMQGFIENIMHLLSHDKTQRAENVCQRIGHIHFHKGLSFTADYVLLFKRTIADQLLLQYTTSVANQQQQQHMAVTVEKTLRFVVKQMKLGFLQTAVKKPSEPALHRLDLTAEADQQTPPVSRKSAGKRVSDLHSRGQQLLAPAAGNESRRSSMSEGSNSRPVKLAIPNSNGCLSVNFTIA